MRVLVYNADGINAYAAEVASIIQSEDLQVELLDAVNGEHEPAAGVRWRRTLPANYADGSPVGKLAALARALLQTAWACGVRRDVLVIAWYRFTVEAVLFTAMARLGRPVVHVLHNPSARSARSRLRRAADAALLGSAPVVVVHSSGLLADVDPAVRPRVVVCPHPPYVQSGALAERAPLELDPDRRWLAFVGNLRPDKGIDLLPQLLDRMTPEDLSGLGLVVCGSGTLPPGPWDRLRGDGMVLVDLTSPTPVSQRTLLGVLQARPVVLAPYVAATQSGTVILSLSTGCPVLAFDQGGIRDVLSDDGLVPTGDLHAMAQAVREGRSGGARAPLDQWARRCAEAWGAAVREAP